MTYEEQLEDPKWKAKRLEILERDWNMCQKCMSTKNLEVHHKQYIDGRLAWDYNNCYLITLCSKCHEQHHKHNDIKVGPPDTILEAFARIKQSVWALKQLEKRG